MSIPITACCIAVLSQQQAEVTYYHNQCSDSEAVPCKNATGMQTVVENGRVIVRAIGASPPEKA